MSFTTIDHDVRPGEFVVLCDERVPFLTPDERIFWLPTAKSQAPPAPPPPAAAAESAADIFAVTSEETQTAWAEPD